MVHCFWCSVKSVSLCIWAGAIRKIWFRTRNLTVCNTSRKQNGCLQRTAVWKYGAVVKCALATIYFKRMHSPIAMHSSGVGTGWHLPLLIIWLFSLSTIQIAQGMSNSIQRTCCASVPEHTYLSPYKSFVQPGCTQLQEKYRSSSL